MVEEQKEKDFVKAAELQVNEIELKVNRNNEDMIDKVIFHTTGVGAVKLDITWKPKIVKDSFEGGFKVSKTVAMERGALPKKLMEIAMICSEKGHCKVKANYHVWNTEKDGQPVTYRYITYEKTFNDWEIVETPVASETVQ